MAEDRRFYVGQKALIERDGRVLVLFNEGNHFDLPGGKSPGRASWTWSKPCNREVREETSLEIAAGSPPSRPVCPVTPPSTWPAIAAIT